jgi:hypothetical protein
MNLQGVKCEGMDWIDLTQDRDRWQAVVKEVMNFGFHTMQEISSLAENSAPWKVSR